MIPNAKNHEVWSSYFNDFKTDEKLMILTIAFVEFLDKSGCKNDEIIDLFVTAKSKYYDSKI